MKQSILEVKGLSCGYGKTLIVRDVSFAIKKGEFMGIIGPNGSGKTTLLRAVNGLLPLAEGTVFFEGVPTAQMGHRELAMQVAVVTQSPEAIPPFSVEEFVLLGRVPHWRRFQFLETEGDLEIAEQAMVQTEITQLGERRMGELSGGERQLACVARALAQQPQVLFLDEPTAHLDIGHQGQIMDLLRQLNRERSLTVVVVLHDLTLAGLYCDRLILLNEGRLHSVGTPQQVLREGIIEEVYRTAVVILETPMQTKPAIVPLPRDK
jgi:iron complex transport system ATP-binding protein